MDTTPKLKKARAAAAFAYINKEYIQQKSEGQEILFPAGDDVSYEDYVRFYQEGDGSEFVDGLYDIFQKNGKDIDQWNKTFTNGGWKTYDDNNDSAHQERWKDVAKYELVSRLTGLENNSSIGGVSRLFNNEPIEEILCPYEAREAMDDFLSNIRKNGDIKRASTQTVKSMAALIKKRFIDSELLSEVMDDMRKDHRQSRLENLLNNYKASNVGYAPNQVEAEFKKDIASSFFQPIGNYCSQVGSKDEKIAKKIAYNKYSCIFLLNVSQQIKGPSIMRAEGNDKIQLGKLRLRSELGDSTMLDVSEIDFFTQRHTDLVAQLASAKVYEEKKDLETRISKLDRALWCLREGQEICKIVPDLVAKGQIDVNSRSFEDAVREIANTPEKFAYNYIQSQPGTSEKDIENVFVRDYDDEGDQMTVDEWVKSLKPPTSFEKIKEAIGTFLGIGLQLLAAPFLFIGSLLAASCGATSSSRQSTDSLTSDRSPSISQGSRQLGTDGNNNGDARSSTSTLPMKGNTSTSRDGFPAAGRTVNSLMINGAKKSAGSSNVSTVNPSSISRTISMPTQSSQSFGKQGSQFFIRRTFSEPGISVEKKPLNTFLVYP